MISYLDLFAGIGGFSLGLENSGQKIGTHYFSEVDRYATAVYRRHFPNAKELGDVRKIDATGLGRIDLVTFGFPCQDLSIAGKQAGFDGTRSRLFYEATRIVREARPAHFIFENVHGLLFNKRGRTIEKVLQEVADIGLYDCEWQLVNSCWFLPHNRERVYFVGHLRGASSPKVFPFETCEGAPPKFPQEKVGCITAGYGMAAGAGSYVVEGQRSCDRLSRHVGPRSSGKADVVPIDSDGIRLRKLTILECERLQGFPDGWTEGHSDSQRYKMLGNAVTAPMAEAIFRRLYAP